MHTNIQHIAIDIQFSVLEESVKSCVVLDTVTALFVRMGWMTVRMTPTKTSIAQQITRTKSYEP